MMRAFGLVLLLTAGSSLAGSRSQDSDQVKGFLSVFDHPVTADALLRDLGPMTATLREAQTLRGNFVQKKILAGVPKPLLAEGRFLFARDLGIIWHTSKPFESELVITQKDILQREFGGAAPRANPMAGPVSQMFFAVFALDFQALEKMFVLHSRRINAAPHKSFSTIPAAGSNAQWEIGLLPRPGLGDAIKRIVISGSAQVERVVLHDRHGDETDIQLRGTTASREALTAAEAQHFK